MANNFYGAIALLGGAAGALDAIDGAGLADLDAAFVQVGGQVYFYTLDATSAAAENSPEVISPDANAGDKRWILQDLQTGANLQVGSLAHDSDIVIKHQTGGTVTNCYHSYWRSGTQEWTHGMNRVGTKWQLYSGVFASGTPAISITEADEITFGNKIIVPQTDEAATPTIAFGDGDTGFYERLDDHLSIAIAGNYRGKITNAAHISATSLGYYILFAGSTATVPTFAFNTDEDTGVGRAAADDLSLIAGGVSGLRVLEAAGVVQVILPLQNNPTFPSLAFGDGNTGIYEESDNVMAFGVSGSKQSGVHNGWGIRAAASNGGGLKNETATATNPSFVGSYGDVDTGMGWGGADILTLIAGGVMGLSVTEAAGIITIRNSDNIELSNTAEGNVGCISERTVREVHTLTLGASSVTTTITIPTGAMLLGVSFNVNDTVADDAGDDTWSAAFSGGSTATLATAAAAAIDTKVNTLIVPEIASGATEITFTPQGGDFTGGIIEVVAYYKSLTSLGDV